MARKIDKLLIENRKLKEENAKLKDEISDLMLQKQEGWKK